MIALKLRNKNAKETLLALPNLAQEPYQQLPILPGHYRQLIMGEKIRNDDVTFDVVS
jgi:hypothetical protein